MYRHFFKRIIDFTITFVALLLLSPILVVIIIWLHFANKGAGVFFTQERPGKNAKIFNIIKFKSMTDECDSDGFLLPNEQRITKIGKFIRNDSIDELPQLINVLKGVMSLIGPCPLLIRYLDLNSTEKFSRHDVSPGLTGWAQVNGRNNITWLAYDHPFIDGNGRTARALFYWQMLRSGYWLFEYITISNEIMRSSKRYYDSFVFTEEDEGDLNYFIVDQIKTINLSIKSLYEYIGEKRAEEREFAAKVKGMSHLNHRQCAVLLYLHKHPDYLVTVRSHELAHGVVKQTARTDLYELVNQGHLERKTEGRGYVFSLADYVSPLDALKGFKVDA